MNNLLQKFTKRFSYVHITVRDNSKNWIASGVNFNYTLVCIIKMLAMTFDNFLFSTSHLKISPKNKARISIRIRALFFIPLSIINCCSKPV